MEARAWALVALSMLLAGCGAAGTGATAAAEAESAAQQAAQGRAAEDKVRQQIDAAYKQAEDQRRAAEADGR
jgi:outer membrane lipoprotein-sorting protein